MIIFSFIQDNGPTLVNTVFVGREQSPSHSQSYQGVKSGILTATKCNLFHTEGTIEGAAYVRLLLHFN